MTSRDWNKARDRSRIARQGAETVEGAGVRRGPPAARKAKASLRAEIDEVAAPGVMVTKLIVCRCGHRGTVRVPIDRLGSVRFRCTCGSLTS